MNVKYKNIVVVDMNFEKDVLIVLVKGKTVKASILTDSKGQYVVVNGIKYYLSKLVYSI